MTDNEYDPFSPDNIAVTRQRADDVLDREGCGAYAASTSLAPTMARLLLEACDRIEVLRAALEQIIVTDDNADAGAMYSPDYYLGSSSQTDIARRALGLTP